MPSRPDSKIRSLKDNPAGRVVADAEGNRWQWDTNEETSIQLQKLHNDELAIERTDIHPRAAKGQAAVSKRKTASAQPPTKRRDAGGGVDPYDNPGKRRRR